MGVLRADRVGFVEVVAMVVVVGVCRASNE